MSIKKDKYYIGLANNIAKNHLGYTGPNPSVGAVIVKNDKVISFGATSQTGRPHAEVNALKLINKKAKKNSTLYVSLEPCSHYGKTPPCVNKIVISNIKRVVYSINDRDPRSSGKSYSILMSKKIKVKKNLLNHISKLIYKNYFYSRLKNKPYIYGKLAISKDFYLKDKSNFYITNDYSLKKTHILRSRANCILTTSKTINDDNPKLNCRINGLNHFTPKVAILDKNLKIKKNSYIIKNAKYNKTFLFYNSYNVKKINYLKSKNLHLIHAPLNKNYLDFNFVIKKLYTFDISSILIEGGKFLTLSLINKKFFNEFYLFISSKKLNKNGALKINNIKSILSKNFKNKKKIDTFLDKDNLIHYY